MKITMKLAPIPAGAKQSEKTGKFIDLVDNDMTPAKPTDAPHKEASSASTGKRQGGSDIFSRQNISAPPDADAGLFSPTRRAAKKAVVARDDDEEWTAKSKKVSEDDDEDDYEDEDDEEFAVATKKRGRATKSGGEKESTSRAKPGKKKVAGTTIEMHRRAVGNAVKSHIHFDKWAIHANTHAEVPMEPEVFRQLVCPNATSIVPSDWTDDSTIVFASASSAGINSLCGSSKVRGGSRFKTWHASKMDFVFFSKTKTVRIWWIMQ
jgi:site-specific DNA-cytosine methylase